MLPPPNAHTRGRCRRVHVNDVYTDTCVTHQTKRTRDTDTSSQYTPFSRAARLATMTSRRRDVTGGARDGAVIHNKRI